MASERRRPAPRPPRHERRVYALALAGGLPALAIALALLWLGDFPPPTQRTLSVVATGARPAFGALARERLVRPLQTLSDMPPPLPQGHHSMPAPRAKPGVP